MANTPKLPISTCLGLWKPFKDLGTGSRAIGSAAMELSQHHTAVMALKTSGFSRWMWEHSIHNPEENNVT